MIEIRLRCEPMAFFPEISHDKLERSIDVMGATHRVDVFLPKQKIVVEYDSNLYHVGKEQRERAKNKALKSEGIIVLRVRQSPLQRISKHDLIIQETSVVKIHKTAVRILEGIEALTQEGIAGLKQYKQRGQTVRDKQADREIDRLGQANGTAQRVRQAAVITSALGSENWRRHNSEMARVSTGKIIVQAEFLDRLIGDADRWRKHPSLLGMKPESLEKKAAVLDQLLGKTRWCKQPQLLLLSSQRLEKRAEDLDEIFASTIWKGQPFLLYLTKKKLKTNARFLTKMVGSDRWKSNPSLLCLTPSNLESNASYLDRLFENDRWKKCPQLLYYDHRTLQRKVKELDAFFPEKVWRASPRLLCRDPARMAANAAQLRDLLGDQKISRHLSLLARDPEKIMADSRSLEKMLGNDKWKNHPGLLSHNVETREAKAKHLDSLIGRSWRNSPVLLTNSSETISRRYHLLERLIGEKRATEALRKAPYLLVRSDLWLEEWASKRVS